MRWNSLAEFMALGGYGFYVWTAFGVTAACMLWEVIALWRRRPAAPTWILQRRLGDERGSP